MSGSTYIVLDYVFKLLALGITWQEVKAKVDAKRAEGMDERAIADFIRDLEGAAIAAAEAKHNPPPPA